MAPSANEMNGSIVSDAQVEKNTSSIRPLDALEIRSAADAVRSYFAGTSPSSLRFSSISLLEPERNSRNSGRRAEVLVLQPTEAAAHHIIVALNPEGLSTVQSASNLGRSQPHLSPDDCTLSERIVKSDAGVLRLLRERHGIPVEELSCDPWSMHVVDDTCSDLHWRADGRPARLVMNFLYWLPTPASGARAHPIDVVPVVDLHAGRVVSVRGAGAPRTAVPDAAAGYHRDGLGGNAYLARAFRGAPRALHVVQPDGPSFAVAGRSVAWQGWTFDVGFNFREGLVLHNVAYAGRPVLRRASLVEMAVPYGDPRAPFAHKCAFDVGDYGLGFCALPLELGCDCLGAIHYFDAVLADAAGEPYTVEKAVCLHEEDAGLAWKHVNYVTMHNESRRARQLVVSFVATVVNYEYLFYWYFKQDGTIEFEIKLSGELSTNVLSPGEEAPEHGTLVAPGVNAQIHQHMFCVRLDPCVDGGLNSVEEVELERVAPGPGNPYGNAMAARVTPLRSELDARRLGAAGRSWRICSGGGRVNRITGRATAYRLVPGTRGGAQPPLLAGADCAVTRRGAFATRALWVTRYSPDERYPAGEFPTQSAGAKGLPEWVRRDAPVQDEDIVVWHSFGVAHLPRVEDFPVMPCESVGFSLKPDGFFLGNPAIDLPPEKDGKSVECGTHQTVDSSARNAAGSCSPCGS